MNALVGFVRGAARIAGVVVLLAASAPAWAQVSDGCTLGVPEIDPGALRSALALLVGGAMVLAGQRRR